MTCDPGPPDGAGTTHDAPRTDDVARRAARALWDADAASRALGMQLLDAGPGRAVVRMPVRADMVQGHGTCHGGVVFALADTAFAMACNTGGAAVGASADITWLAPARIGDVLRAEAVEEARTGRSGVTRVRVLRERDGALLALFQGRSRALRRPLGDR